jgi:hypothetical protein
MLLVSVPGFAQTLPSFTPTRETGTPTYLNAEVVRLSSNGTATIRSESGDVVLTADLRAVAGLGVRPGDKLLLAYETVYDDSGRERRIVTYARPASPGSGEPGPSFAMVAAGASGASTVRLISADRANRTITVTDASGEPLTLPLSAQATANLGGIRPGDVIGLDFANGGVVNPNALPVVSGFQALPAGTGVGSFVVPPLSGQFVGFDAGTNMVTVQTANGRQQTFTVSGAAGAGLANLRPGDNLSLGFQVTQQANRARVRAGGNTTVSTAPGAASLGAAGGSTLLSVGNVSTLTRPAPRTTDAARFGSTAGRTTASRGTFSDFGAGTTGVTGAANVGAATTNAQAARLATAQAVGGQNNTFTNQNLAGFSSTAGAGAGQGVSVNDATANRTGIAAGGFSPIGGTSVGTGGVPATGIPGANTGVGAAGAPGTAGTAGTTGTGTFNNMGAGLPFLGTGFATPSVGPGSPFANTVPSVPTPGPIMTAVLPPATAKAPLSQEEVGLLRAYGERDLDAAAVVLAMVANDIDAGWFRFKMACLGGFTAETSPGREWFLLLDDRVRTPTDDACRAMYAQLQGQATGWETQLNIALDAARRADVLPGRVRETLDRHRIDR